MTPQVLGNMTASADATFAAFNGVNIFGLTSLLLIAVLLLLLTSTRVFSKIRPILGRFATLIKRTLEGWAVYSIGNVIYISASSLTGLLTLEDVLHLGKWGAAFTALGLVSAWVRHRIYRNATGEPWPNTHDLFDEKKEAAS